ncbi:MAG: diguanylate cyclase [Desulfotomaculaceae bacterium]|nr:diguanylate cyclase [Desulfotomaculaceae bacterium]
MDFYLFCILLVLFIYVLTVNNITTLHKAYLAFHSLMMLWPICNFIINITPDQHLQWFFLNVAFIGLSFLGFGWLMFSLVLTRKFDGLKRPVFVLSVTPAVLCSILATTNPWHFMFAHSSSGGWAVRTYGPFFWFFSIYVLGYLLLSSVLIFRTAINAPESNMKKQVSLCMWGVIILIVFSQLDILFNVALFPLFGVVPGLTSFGIVASAVCYVIAINKYDLFRIVTIAQREVVDSMAIGMFVIDKDEIVLDLNKSATKFLKTQAGRIFDIKELLQLSKTQSPNSIFLEDYNTNKLKNLHTEVKLIKEQIMHVSINISPVLDDNKNLLGRIITLNDVTELRSLLEQNNENNAILLQQNKELLRIQEELYDVNKKLEKATITDDLTDCYNKRYLMQQVACEILASQRYKVPFSILLIDIDKFKLINDAYGHLLGDDVLRGVVDAIKSKLRRSDILVRFGGDEFIIYMPNTDRAGAFILAEKVRSTIESYSISSAKGVMHVTISVGLVSVGANAEISNNPEKFMEELLERADWALYESKENGRNCVVFEPSPCAKKREMTIYDKEQF